MANYNLTNQPISASFQQLLQKNDNDFLVDGTGSLVETLKVTGSVSSSTYYGDGSNLTGIATGSGGSVDTGSLLTTASVVDATITYTKGDGTTFTNTVNNVVNATSASHAEFAEETDDVILNVKNTSGADIGKGLAVHATGVTGENVNIKLADSSVSGDMPAIGITRDAISNNASGVVILSGKVKGLNTAADGLVAGAAVYVNGAGVLTSTKPTGSDLIQNIGICGKVDATDGEIIVMGSGRSNDLPNITEGYLWVGNENGVPEAISTGSFVKELETGSFARTDTGNTFTTGSQIIQSNEGIILQADGGGTTGQVQLTPGANAPSKLTPAKLTGLEYIDMIAISSSTHYVGKLADDVSIKNLQTGGNSSIDLTFGGTPALRLRSGSDNAELNGDVIIQGNVTSSISKQNVIVTPQTVTDDITISTNNNAFVVGDTTFAGTVTIEGDSELSIFGTPALGELIETASISGQTLTFTKQDASTFDIQIPAQSFDTGSFLTTSSYEIDSASFDTRIDGNASLTNNNTLNGNQIVSGSLTGVAGIEVGNLSLGAGGTANLGVLGSIILRSGSGIVTDGAFGTSVPFDSSVTFFNGLGMQGTEMSQIGYLDFNNKNPLPGNASGDGGRLAVSASNLYYNDGSTWTKIN
jgi:hypothetical protein